MPPDFSADELDFEECARESTNLETHDEIPSTSSAPPPLSFESDEEMFLDENELSSIFSACMHVTVDSLTVTVMTISITMRLVHAHLYDYASVQRTFFVPLRELRCKKI